MIKTFKYYFPLFILGLFILYSCGGNNGKKPTYQALDGFWEGQLPLGKEYILVLHFNANNPGEQNFIQLFKSGIRQSNDPIKSINVENDSFSFKIKSVNGLYKFKKDKDILKGILSFPNGQQANVYLKKVIKPSVGDFTQINSSRKINLLVYKYPKNKILEDYDFFIKSIEDNQPNLYAFITKKNFETLVSKTRKNLNKKYTQMQFLRILSTVTEKIGCGHLGVGPSAEISQYIDSVRFLPFFIKIIEEKVYIGENYIDKLKDKPGMQLLSINGRKIDDILAEIENGLPVDHRNLSSKIAIIEHSFPSVYINYIEAAKHYTIEYRNPKTGKEENIEFEGLKFGNLLKVFYVHHPDKIPGSFPVTLQIINKNTALIKVTQFYYKDFDIFYHSVDSIFTSLNRQKINNLIIDLRGNSGGDPRLSFYLLTKFARNDFIYFKSPKSLKNIYPALFAKKAADPKAFKGKVFILMDGRCKSSAAHFLANAKYQGWAKLVGSETGATYWCNASTEDLVLPNTKIKLVQPTREVVANVEGWKKLSPLKPDYEVKYTYDDLIKNIDPDLEFTLKLINKNKNEN